jgi:ABC-2 type transport system permease protein
MVTIYRATLAGFWGQILGWGAILFLLSWMTVARYDLMLENQDVLERLTTGSAARIIALFGDPAKLTSPEGFLSLALFSYLPLILGVFAILAGSGLLAADEEKGTLDLVLAYPVSRAALFTGRVLAFATAVVAVLALSWLGFVVAIPRSSLAVDSAAMARPYVSLLALLLFFGTLALLASMLLPSRRQAAMAAGMVLLASFFLTTLARLDNQLETIARFSPITYYQGGEAIPGLNGKWFSGLMLAGLLFSGLAWWCFDRRDIRVAGEGVWRWPTLRRKHS